MLRGYKLNSDCVDL